MSPKKGLFFAGNTSSNHWFFFRGHVSFLRGDLFEENKKPPHVELRKHKFRQTTEWQLVFSPGEESVEHGQSLMIGKLLSISDMPDSNLGEGGKPHRLSDGTSPAPNWSFKSSLWKQAKITPRPLRKGATKKPAGCGFFSEEKANKHTELGFFPKFTLLWQLEKLSLKLIAKAPAKGFIYWIYPQAPGCWFVATTGLPLGFLNLKKCRDTLFFSALSAIIMEVESCCIEKWLLLEGPIHF